MEHVNRKYKNINIKDQTCFVFFIFLFYFIFFDDMIDIKKFDSIFLKLDKKSYKNIDICYINYITMKDHLNINIVNPLYLVINEVDRYIEERNGNKYLIFLLQSKKEVLTKYTKLRDGIRNLIKKINDKPSGYNEKYIQIKINSDDILPLNKILKLHGLTVLFRSAFQKDYKYYPQVLLDECLYEL